jgi:hypothetical protein
VRLAYHGGEFSPTRGQVACDVRKCRLKSNIARNAATSDSRGFPQTKDSPAALSESLFVSVVLGALRMLCTANRQNSFESTWVDLWQATCTTSTKEALRIKDVAHSHGSGCGMSYQRLLVLATLFAVGAFLVLVLRIAHPHHRQLALVLYGIGWVPFVLSIRNFWITFHGHTWQVLRWKNHILAGITFLLFVWTFKVLIPVEKSPLLGADLKRLPAILAADQQHLAFIDSKIQAALTELLESPLVEADQLSTDESLELGAAWARFVEASFELDLLKVRYRAFYQVNGFTHPKLHAEAFLIAFSAHVSQYRAAALATARISRYETAQKLLDDAHPEAGLPAGSFARVQLMVSHPDEILRLNAGRAYLLVMKRRLENDDSVVVRTESQITDLNQLVLTDIGVFVNNPLDVLEQKASGAWFPVQKGVALGMASVRTVARDYFISPADLEAEAANLLPGDIMLTRREWHLTNLGIPGYWTHAALHIGPIEQMDRYFADLPELEGRTASTVIQKYFPEVYVELRQKDSAGNTPAVIEALRPGVIVQSLQDSASADSLAVLRPQVAKADRWKAIMAALPHYGKPYNYQFDFRTETALVCSQLIHKAYEMVGGLVLQPKMSGGRLLLSPNEIAIKYDREMGQPAGELELVLFLDGAAVGQVRKRGAEEFRESWSRPKWHIVFQDE